MKRSEICLEGEVGMMEERAGARKTLGKEVLEVVVE